MTELQQIREEISRLESHVGTLKTAGKHTTALGRTVTQAVGKPARKTGAALPLDILTPSVTSQWTCLGRPWVGLCCDIHRRSVRATGRHTNFCMRGNAHDVRCRQQTAEQTVREFHLIRTAISSNRSLQHGTGSLMTRGCTASVCGLVGECGAQRRDRTTLPYASASGSVTAYWRIARCP